MNAQDIIAQIVKMHKDHTPSDVFDILEGKALISWHAEIFKGLVEHETNEPSAPNYALTWLAGRLTNDQKFS